MADISLIFPAFPRLPVELRENIWRLCLPTRVIELDEAWPEDLFDLEDFRDPAPCDTNRCGTFLNTRPPLITLVCHESRRVAFEDGHATTNLVSPSGLAPPPEAEWYAQNAFKRTFWLSRRGGDHAHLHWTSVHDDQVWCPEDRSALTILAWASRNISRGPGSLNFSYLLASISPFESIDEDLEPVSNENLRDLGILKQVPTWLVVMKVLIVHSPRQAAASTGLFGLLGDEAIQVLDMTKANNHVKITALHALAANAEQDVKAVEPRQDFSVPSLDELQTKLRDVAMRCYRDEDVIAHLRPAIMFQLCNKFCNHK